MCVFGNSLNAQQNQIRKLEKELTENTNEDTARVRRLIELSTLFQYVQVDSMIRFADEAYRISEKLNFKLGMANALRTGAIAQYYQSNVQTAIQFNQTALKLYNELDYQKGIGDIYNNMAIIYHNQGDLDSALNYYTRSMNIRTKILDRKGIAACLNNIGNIHTNLGNFSEALSFLFRSLTIREQLGDSISITNSFSNIAGVYVSMRRPADAIRYASKAAAYYTVHGNKDGMYQTSVITGEAYHLLDDHKRALEFFKSGLKYAEEMRNDNAIAVCLTDLGREQLSLSDLYGAEASFNRALQLGYKTDDKEGIAISYIHLGGLAIRRGKIAEGIQQLHSGLDLAKLIQSKLQIHDAALRLSEAYQKHGDFQKALTYLQLSYAYKDSLFNDETKIKMQQSEFNYRLDKKQREIQMLELQKSVQNEISQRQQVVITSLICAFLLILMFFIAMWRNHQKEKQTRKQITLQKAEIEKQAENLEELNRLKDKVFSVMSHDLRSPVASLLSMMELLDDEQISQHEFLTFKEHIKEQLVSLSLLLDNLLNWSRSHMAGAKPVIQSINLYEKVHRICELYIQMAVHKQIELVCTIGPDLKVLADSNYLALVLRNLLSNAIKFTPMHGTILVSATEREETVEISFKDSGIGMTTEKIARLFNAEPIISTPGTSGERGAGVGLMMCAEFIAKTGGGIRVTSEPGRGSTFIVSLPKA